MHLWFQSTSENLNAQINKLQHILHIIENNRHLDAPGLAFLSTVSLGLFWDLAQVLIQVSIINRSTLRSDKVRGNQLVITVDQIYRFYMKCRDEYVAMRC